MKKYLILLMVASLSIAVVGCGNTKASVEEEAPALEEAVEASVDDAIEDTVSEETVSDADPTVDLDLTALSSTMIYSEVFNMVMEPEAYEGQTVKMDGICNVYVDEETDKTYYACIVQDATQCCAQGLEFILDESLYDQSQYP
ncbi:MAG: hypothetical protein IJ675_05125, partial [Pseudobutyrivibrio sp.]|nr:hypothetical protein [Pseudobutyrivibrio sp.]